MYKLIDHKGLEWKIASLCGVSVLVLLILSEIGEHLVDHLVDRLKSWQTMTLDETDGGDGEPPAPSTRILRDKIGQKQLQLTELETRLHQIEGIARTSEDELGDLYRQISDMQGEIESDKAKLRLRSTGLPSRH
jgi:uncharacterized coiled-coil protein SlyX